MAVTRTIEQWAKLIRKDLTQAVEGIIKAGQHLAQAKLQLGHGNFGAMLNEAGIHERTARRLMSIADNAVLADPANADHLPTSMRTLSELATLPVPTLEGYIRDGVITIDMERADVEGLKHPKTPKPPKPAKGPTVRARNTFTEAEIRDMSGPEPAAAAKLREALAERHDGRDRGEAGRGVPRDSHRRSEAGICRERARGAARRRGIHREQSRGRGDHGRAYPQGE